MTAIPATSRRLPTGGRIDRSAPIGFSFDGTDYSGFRGDTLASALLANGVRVLGRSIYRERPRGIVAAGAEEPNALVEVTWPGGAADPMLRATQVELVEGLRARPLAGVGRLAEPAAGDTRRCDKRHANCDVLVVGGGPAGLGAALAAGRTGGRVVLVDEGPELGGTLLATPDEGGDRIDGGPPMAWVAGVVEELRACPEVGILTRATAVGHFDHNYVLVSERRGVADGRLWHIRAREVVLATGAHERPIAFADNDRPGVMLAGAVRTYLGRFAVRPGERAVVFTTNDTGIACARELAAAGVEIATVVDARMGVAVVGTAGEPTLTGVTIMPVDADGRPTGNPQNVECDLLAVAGGWNPAVHLHSQARGTLRYDDGLACFVPGSTVRGVRTAGAGNGTFGLAEGIAEGHAAGAAAALAAGFGDGVVPDPPAVDAPVLPSRPDVVPGSIAPLWLVPGPDGDGEADWSTHFIDLERDATVADLSRAVGAGLRSMEHVKRFTTVGTASDQGKTSGVLGSAIAASLMGRPVGEAGLTTYRPPYVPVSFALLAGRDRGELHDPVRTTSIHSWHVARGAVFEDVGQWKRARFYPLPGESMEGAVLRESAAARGGVAVMDASTLGKIDLQGPDSGEFLNRVYTNAFAKLPVGSCRYGVMCRPDGMVFDDGVTSRLADDRFLMTTTTGNAAPVLDHLEEWLQTEWPTLRVRATSVTEQWATIAVVGPRSRDVLRALTPGLALAPEDFPFMTWRDAEVAGVRARVFRISFSGELAYEINVPTWHGLAMWEAVVEAGARYGITPYGTETMHVLRAEKGYPIVGQETDGTVTPQDLGMDWIVSKTKGDFIGRRSHRRPDTARPDRKQLVGLLPVDPEDLLPEGAQLVDDRDEPVPMRMVGHVTSSYRSAALGRTFALALVRRGRERLGEVVHAPLVDRTIAATIAPSVLYDPDNLRRDGDAS